MQSAVNKHNLMHARTHSVSEQVLRFTEADTSLLLEADLLLGLGVKH